MERDFRIIKRNPCHWDIWAKDSDRERRVYRIRGEEGNIVLWGDHDYRDKPERTFSSVSSCMAEICAEFMKEG